MPSSDTSRCTAECYDLDYYHQSFQLKSIKSKGNLLNILKEFGISFNESRVTYLLDATFQDEDSEPIKVKYKKLGEFIPKPNENQLLLYSYYISRDSVIEFDYVEDKPIVVNYKKLLGNKVIQTVEQSGKELELEPQGCGNSVQHCFGYRLLLFSGETTESSVSEIFMFADEDDLDEETSTRLDEIAGMWYSEILQYK
jgi:hypothetical protein